MKEIPSIRIKYSNRENMWGQFVTKSRLIIILCAILTLVSVWHWQNWKLAAVQSERTESTAEEKDYIKWVEFNVTCEAMNKAYYYDIDINSEIKKALFRGVRTIFK